MRAQPARLGSPWFSPNSGSELRVRRAGLRGEADVGERPLAVPVVDDSGHLAVADTDQDRSLRPHLPELQAACPAAAAPLDEREYTLAVEFAVLVRLEAEVLPGIQVGAGALC